MEKRIELIKKSIDRYLKYAEQESNCVKKDAWVESAARWEQYLKEISGIRYREADCGISRT